MFAKERRRKRVPVWKEPCGIATPGKFLGTLRAPSVDVSITRTRPIGPAMDLQELIPPGSYARSIGPSTAFLMQPLRRPMSAPAAPHHPKSSRKSYVYMLIFTHKYSGDLAPNIRIILIKAHAFSSEKKVSSRGRVAKHLRIFRRICSVWSRVLGLTVQSNRGHSENWGAPILGTRG